MPDLHFTSKALQQVAVLLCEGMQTPEIATILSTSVEHVQRMSEVAEERGYFAYLPTLTLDELDPKVQEFVYEETLTTTLRNVLQGKLELEGIPIFITPSPSAMFHTFTVGAKEGSEEYKRYRQAEWESTRRVCRRAAHVVSKFLFDGQEHTIGLNWGTIVHETIQHLQPLPSQLGDAQISVVSLFGDLAFHAPYPLSSSFDTDDVNCNALVTRMARRLGRSSEAVLLNVPGFIPAHFAQTEAYFHALRTFMDEHVSYRQIFGSLPDNVSDKPREIGGVTNRPPETKLSQMDTIITGFGSADAYTQSQHYLQSWLSSTEMETLRQCVPELIAGDLGGHLIPTPRGSEDDHVTRFFKSLNRRLLAVQPSDFIDVATRHLQAPKGAGVVGIAVGARKAKILYILLSWRTCPISQLVMDTHCALALLHLLDPGELKSFLTSPAGGCLRSPEWSEDTKQCIPVE